MFKPISTQNELDAVVADRIRRERSKIRQKDSEELEPYIDKLDQMLLDLIELRNSWKENQSHQDNSCSS